MQVCIRKREFRSLYKTW